MVGLDGEQQKIREGMEDDRAVIAEIAVGVHRLRQPKAHVLCEELDRSIVNGKVHLAHVGIGDWFHQTGFEMNDLARIGARIGVGIGAGILGNPSTPFEFGRINDAFDTKHGGVARLIFALLEGDHPGGLTIPL